MPSSVRPKGSSSGSRAAPVTPMSERQQMALLMQMTSGGNEVGSRSPSSSGARSRERNERGETPLHLAAIKGDVEQICKLLAHRADPNAVDFAGWTPLHEACNYGRYDAAVRLVQSGASVNARGLDDDTPLHDAVANGHWRLARFLIERGADPRARNARGKTALDLAPTHVRQCLVDLNLPIPDNTSGSRSQPRSRDEKKTTSGGPGGGDSTSTAKQKDDPMDVKNSEDVYEFKSVKDGTAGDSSPDRKSSSTSDSTNMETDKSNDRDPLSISSSVTSQNADDGSIVNSNTPGSSKRTFSDVSGSGDAEESSINTITAAGTGNDEESRRKKRKEDNIKEGKSTTQRGTGQGKGQGGKQSSGSQSKSSSLNTTKGGNDKNSPCSSPKPTSDQEVEDGKSDLKVPPLKIVIPQTTSSEQEGSQGRNGKSGSQRAHPALPYVVASSNSGSSNAATDSGDKEQSVTSAAAENSSTAPASAATTTSKGDEKKDAGNGGGAVSDEVYVKKKNSQQQHSDAEPSTSSISSSATTSTTSTPSTSTSTATSAPTVDLHPRKRKMKQSKEQAAAAAAAQSEPAESSSTEAQVHPHDQPITNCYQLFLDIRKQIGKRRRGLFPVQPKPPQGFKDYLMNRCTYVLAGTAPTTPNITFPQNLPPQMKDLFTEQEKERYRLRTQHVIEKEKLVLSVEQEILRVHGRAARALANQSLPFSVCTILRDEEVYNLITPEQEEKDRNARSRYNGRLFLSWLQDVDDKWEKIKEHMLLRHHNEAESLHAVQKMDWEWKLKELSLCDKKTTPKIEETHVPMVHVSDDFDLLPA